MFLLLSWKTYIADVGPENVREGMERSGLPEGIPSLPEYLAEYCSLAVSVLNIYVSIDFGIIYCVCCYDDIPQTYLCIIYYLYLKTSW